MQVANRVTRRFKRPRLWDGEIPAPVPAAQAWQAVQRPARITAPDTAVFLNEPGPLLQWHNPGKSHLWLYNLHYFEDLLAQGSQLREHIHRAMITSWLQANPPVAGVGWEPYPLSLRLANWIKWLLGGSDPVPGMLESLYQQAHVLNQRLEYHLLGNHLLANAAALIFAGTFFSGDGARAWLQKGLRLYREQLAEQQLSDGAHFELSPMYHCLVLLELLDLIQLGRCYPASELAAVVPELKERALAMQRWLAGMLHPDGEIPFFNDAAFGIAPPPAAIFSYARELGLSPPVAPPATCVHQASGYIALRRHEQVALLDVAAVGPGYIPGHAHADTLSFEWSLGGQRVLVNSGASVYGAGEERLRQRGTAAHNTVAVNGENSSEVWSGFRVARRARPFGVQVEEGEDRVLVRASHSGYQRLRPRVTHTRQWQVRPGELVVTDRLDGDFREAVAFFHCHPSVTVTRDGNQLALASPGGVRCELFVKGGRAEIHAGTWHPQFGLSQPNQHVAVTFSGPLLETRISC